jgi:hypothetical protein
MDLSNKTPLSQNDYLALDVLEPGSVVLFSAQLGDGDPLRQIGNDPQLQRWLSAHQDVVQIVRMWPVRGPDDPKRLALRILRLHLRFPWIVWFQITNEPEIEWSRDHANWQEIGAWAEAVWWDVEYYRRHVPGASDIKLLFPPFAQGSVLDPEHVGYDAVREAVELYLDHGDGLAGHEYWDRDDVYLVEDRWPAWLQDRISTAGRSSATAGQTMPWATKLWSSRLAPGPAWWRHLFCQVRTAHSISSTSSTATATCDPIYSCGAHSVRNAAPRLVSSRIRLMRLRAG